MKEFDRVILTVEKEKYATEGVHKGMDGWICDPRKIDGKRLVSFDQYGELPEIACLSVNEEDLEVLISDEPYNTYAIVVTDREKYARLGVHKGMYGKVLWEENSKKGAIMIEFIDSNSNKTLKVEILRDDLKEYKGQL
ncbi:MAG: hypothetical protein RR248_02335 [Clostridia bacterium]